MTQEERDQKYNYYLRELDGATLEKYSYNPIESYWLRQQEKRYSTLIIFSPAGIIITGDLRPDANGVIAPGYNKAWFSDPLDWDYLASKFLHTEWVPERIQMYFKETQARWLEEYNDIGKELDRVDGPVGVTMDKEYKKAGFEKVLWHIGRNEFGPWNKIEALTYWLSKEPEFDSPSYLWDQIPFEKESRRPLFDSEELSFGYGYPDYKVGWLLSIQRHFSQLIKVLEPVSQSA